MTLCDVFKRHNTDKHHTHHYCAHYERHLPPAHEEISLLELGVEEGNSLRAWEQWFPNARILGVDDNSEASSYRLDQRFGASRGVLDRAHVVISDQSHPKLLHYGHWDVVIDDASHVGERTAASFRLLFPRLNHGGLYVIEDLETSYYTPHKHGRDYGGGPVGTKGTSVHLVQQLVDAVNREYHNVPCPPISEMHLYKNIAFIRKGGTR